MEPEISNITPTILDSTANIVGESPLWHPLRHTLYWLDFPNSILFSYKNRLIHQVKLKSMVTAIAWIDEDYLLMATAEGLFKYNIDTEKLDLIINIENKLTSNRSNDGRADPWGGFWIGTMNIYAKAQQGGLYRWHLGELRQLVEKISIPNGICFDKHRSRGYFADSLEKKVYVLKLDQNSGWPISQPTVFYDFNVLNVSPDGAVVDAKGNIWIALWDGGKIMCISPDGEEIQCLYTDTPRPTCPAFGGLNATTLFITSAAYKLEDTEVNLINHGATFFYSNIAHGVFEPAVIVK